jgi:ribosomal protein S12 methylthiotransferase accessory factor
MIRLHSSLRAVEPARTLEHAKTLAHQLQISRVTDITRLDRIGIPVYSSVRPTAVVGSLCVNAGKGATLIDARVGAYMEAIEYALAEPGASPVTPTMRTARDVLDGAQRPNAVLDFCPIARREFDLDAPLACVEVEEMLSGRSVLAPAELVFLPYVLRRGTGNFGSHSNGLASGNTLDEGTVHGLFEVIERDVRSFHRVRDGARLVRDETLPRMAQAMLQQVAGADLKMCLRALPNEFEIPCFEALLSDPFTMNSLLLNAGYGCHLVAEIAALRAITEAVQSRLSWIHGARDDLEEAEAAFGPVDPGLLRRVDAQFARYRDDPHPIDYADVEAQGASPGDIEQALAETFERLLRRGIRHVCRIAFTPPSSPLQVLRIIVPRLEYLDRFSHRVGPRLHAYLRS